MTNLPCLSHLSYSVHVPHVGAAGLEHFLYGALTEKGHPLSHGYSHAGVGQGHLLLGDLLWQEVWSVGLQQEFVEGEVAGHIVGLHTLSVGDHWGQSNIQPGEGLHPPLGPRVVTRKTVTMDLVVSRHHLLKYL